MPIVRIEMWPGRTRERKNALISSVSKAVAESLDVPLEAVDVLLYEVDKTEWARGGISHADRQTSP